MEERSVYSLDAEKRSVTRALRYALIVAVAMAGVVLGLLATASGNTKLFERHYPLLLWLNVAIAAGLLLLVIELGRRLVSRFRRGVFGTRLMARLAASFAMMTVIPGILIYFIAVQFLGRAVDSWFSVPVEAALSAGMNLSRAALDAQLNDLALRARRMEVELSDVSNAQLHDVLGRLRDQAAVAEVAVLSQSGRLLGSSTSQFTQLMPDVPSSAILQQVALTRQYTSIEAGEGNQPERNLKLRVVRQLLTRNIEETRYLQLLQPVSSRVAENAEAVRVGERDYQELLVARQGLKKIFRITLTLTLLLTLFSAVAAAFLLAGWLTGPLTMLAAGTRAVSEGDFRQVKDYSNRDELGVLTQSFNRMTRQLTEARAEVQVNQRELEQANAKLNSVLTNMISGVLAFDSHWRLVLANPGADAVVGAPCQRLAGAPIEDIPVIGAFAANIRRAYSVPSWKEQFTLEPVSGEAMQVEAEPRTLLVQGGLLGAIEVEGYLLVFDDISPVVAAQRTVAWREVARRLAHEIKNPLTPIQLAAERLEFKLADKLAHEDAELVRRNARTIVNQVGAMKRMVDEFRDYARMPAAVLEPLDLNEIATELTQLYSSGSEAPNLRFTAELDAKAPMILGDATQLRQLVHNLLKNAVEAVAGRDDAQVLIATKTINSPPGLRLLVQDNGPGFGQAVLKRAFEPYVTSKVKGTGLGLAIVKKIVEDHGASIEIGNREKPETGAELQILFRQLAPTRTIDESPQ